MSNMVIRYLRCIASTPAARPEPHKDGVLAVAAVHEATSLARLLLADMSTVGARPRRQRDERDRDARAGRAPLPDRRLRIASCRTR